MPKEPGEAQQELGIEKEASYIISVINPRKPVASSVAANGGKYPSTEEISTYPEEVLREFGNSDIFVSLSKDTKTDRLLKCTDNTYWSKRRKRCVIKSEIGIEIGESSQSADIIYKLKVRKNQVPIRPLTEGKLE